MGSIGNTRRARLPYAGLSTTNGAPMGISGKINRNGTLALFLFISPTFVYVFGMILAQYFV